MMYDRCSNCRHPMEFHAITSIRGIWRRWLHCVHCTQFTHADQFGDGAIQSKSMPVKTALAKDEDYDADEGNTLIRFGQDDIQSLSEL